jgi:hypothetical protein
MTKPLTSEHERERVAPYIVAFIDCSDGSCVAIWPDPGLVLQPVLRAPWEHPHQHNLGLRGVAVDVLHYLCHSAYSTRAQAAPSCADLSKHGRHTVRLPNQASMVPQQEPNRVEEHARDAI